MVQMNFYSAWTNCKCSGLRGWGLHGSTSGCMEEQQSDGGGPKRKMNSVLKKEHKNKILHATAIKIEFFKRGWRHLGSRDSSHFPCFCIHCVATNGRAFLLSVSQLLTNKETMMPFFQSTSIEDREWLLLVVRLLFFLLCRKTERSARSSLPGRNRREKEAET